MLSKELSRFKQIETGLVVAKEECHKSIEKCLKRAKESGTKFITMLAKGLEEVDNNYALNVLNENRREFGSYNMKKFKAMISNAGYEFVADNIPDLTAP